MDEPDGRFTGPLLGDALRELAGAADDDLASFRSRWLGPESALDLEHLERTRDILRLLGLALASADERRFRHVRSAWEILCRITAELGPPDSATTGDGPVTLPRGSSFVNASPSDDGTTIADDGTATDMHVLGAVPRARPSNPVSDAIPLARPQPPTLAVERQNPPAVPSPSNAAAGEALCSRASDRADLADYASLCAVCAVFPERTALAEAQHGVVDEAARHSLDAFWQARFTLEPELGPLFTELVAQFSSFLQQLATVELVRRAP